MLAHIFTYHVASDELNLWCEMFTDRILVAEAKVRSGVALLSVRPTHSFKIYTRQVRNTISAALGFVISNLPIHNRTVAIA